MYTKKTDSNYLILCSYSPGILFGAKCIRPSELRCFEFCLYSTSHMLTQTNEYSLHISN